MARSAAGRAALRFRGAAGRHGAPGGRGAAGGGAGDAPKTRRWVDGLRDIDRAAAALSRKTRVISVMDREADCFAVFDEQRRLNRVEVLVRAHHDRCLAKGAPKLFAARRAGAADGHVEIEIDRLSARRKSSGRQGPPGAHRAGGAAEVRHRQVVAPPTSPAPNRLRCQRSMCAKPRRRPASRRSSGSCSPVSTSTAPKPRSRSSAYYLRRWRIEDLFRVLKSGCRVEHLAFHTADRLQRAVTINTVIAWRLMVMTLLGRDVPGCDAQLLFTDIELRS